MTDMVAGDSDVMLQELRSMVRDVIKHSESMWEDGVIKGYRVPVGWFISLDFCELYLEELSILEDSGDD